MSNSIIFDVLARDRASRTFDHVGDSASRASKGVRLAATALKYAAVAAAVGVAATATAGFKLAQAAAEDQTQVVMLSTALKNSADASDAQVASTEGLITKWGKAYGVADDQLRPAMARLAAATHDVGKTQDDVALAMDVAAGRKVKLETVTNALAKAELGQMGGLSRLGVQTKDAAGETRSLESVTRELAVLYGGQAAKAADTTAGKWGRVKLVMDETGEAIGYRLLPYGDQLADWVLNKAVPAGEKLAQAFDAGGLDGFTTELERLTDHQGDLMPVLDGAREVLGEVGDVVTGSVVPAFQTLNGLLPGFATPLGLINTGLGFMADHAGLTKVALEAYVIATMAAKVQTGLAAVQTRGWGIAASVTSGQVGTLGSKLKTAGGVGGALALAYGAEHAGTNLGLMASAAGGATLGWSVGGPWGAAVGAGVGALGGLAAANDQAREAARRNQVTTDELADTLDEVTLAATAATRQLVLKDLQNHGLVESAASVGVSSRLLVSAAMGEKDAVNEVYGAYARYTHRLEEVGDRQGYLTDEQKRGLDAAQAFGDDIEGLGGKFKIAVAGARAARNATGDLTEVVKLFPKRIRSEVQLKGVPENRRDIVDLTQKYHLMPKDIRVLIKQSGVPTTVREVLSVIDRLKELDRQKPNPKIGADDREAKSKAAGVKSDLSRIDHTTATANVKVDTGSSHWVLDAFNRAVADATRDRNLDIYVHTHNLPGKSNAVQQGMNGRLRIEAEEAGQEVAAGVVKGAAQAVKNSAARLRGLMEESNSFAAGFQGFAGTSIFGAPRPMIATGGRGVGYINGVPQGVADAGETTEGPQTIGNLIAFARAQRGQAAQVKADVDKLLDKGLSAGLIKQMQSETGGIDQIHALASGSRDQIAMINALQKATSRDLQAAGMSAADRVYGDRIAGARNDLQQAQLMQALPGLIEGGIFDALSRARLKAEGDDLVLVVERTIRKRGKTPALSTTR